MVGRFETQEYRIPVAGRTLRLLGPMHPHALRNDPEVDRRFVADGYMPYWAYPTPTAVMLAEYVCANVTPEKGAVLELGAGLGLVGLALSLCGYRVTITDYDHDALEFVRANAALNAIETAAACWLDWREPPAEQYRLILGGDVVYEKRSHVPIAALLASCLSSGGLGIFSDQNRRAAETFPEAVSAAGLRCERVFVSGPAIPRHDAIDGRILKGTLYCVSH